MSQQPPSPEPPPPGGDPNQDPYTVPVGRVVDQRKSSSTSLIIILAVGGLMMLFCGGTLVALLVPAVSAARQAAQRMQRSNNVKQVGLALHNYHSAYKQLPFTTVNDTAGRETIGWRVALSPFAEGQRQWESFAMDEPWDSVNNAPLMTDAPMAFQSIKGGPGETAIFAIVSPQGLFPDTSNTKVQFRDCLDGLANTIMAIEFPVGVGDVIPVTWSSTQDMTPDEAYNVLGSLPPREVAHALMGDGAVIALSSDLDRQTFDDLVTRDGGETIGNISGF